MWSGRLTRSAMAAAFGALSVGLVVVGVPLAQPHLRQAVPAPGSPPTQVRTASAQRSLPFGRDEGRLVDKFTAHVADAGTGLPTVAGSGPASPGIPAGESAPGEDTDVLTAPSSVASVAVRKILLKKGELLSMPVRGPITSNFGMRHHPILNVYKLHTGTDFGVACGTPVGAAARGVVVSAGWAGGNGVQVVVDHGVLGGHHIRTTYNHLSAIGVQVGQAVDTGDGVGLVGSTGYSTGCHLHFEVIADGQFTDPVPWLNGRAVVVDISAMRMVGLGRPMPSSSPSVGASPSPGILAGPSPSPSHPASTSPSQSASPSSYLPASDPSSSTPTSPSPSDSSSAPPSSEPAPTPTEAPSSPTSQDPSGSVPTSPTPTALGSPSATGTPSTSSPATSSGPESTPGPESSLSPASGPST